MKSQESASSSSPSSSSLNPFQFAPNSGGGATAAEEPSSSSTAAAEAISIDRRNPNAVTCRWSISNFSRIKSRALWSKYFDIGDYDCRLLVYPRGDSQALPGYLSVYLQIIDPRGGSNSKWDCFASCRLSIVNHSDSSKSVTRDSWHRFSSKKKSHGWCDFMLWNVVEVKSNGFLVNNDTVVVKADIYVLDETVTFSNDDGVSGKFTWKVHNFSLFREMIKTQKIMSPVFPAGDCNLKISVYQSVVGGVEHLSLCLESKDTEKNLAPDRSSWCLFRMSILNQKPGLTHMHRESYGRFGADNKGGDNTSLGWNDYMKMKDFLAEENGYLVDNGVVFSTSYNVIKECCSFTKNIGLLNGGRTQARKSDGHYGKFTWRIENFTRLKEWLKKKKITGLCVKSRKFQIGNRDCRLIVYPRGQSQPPCHLSVFLEVTDSRSTNINNDWSCFVSHRLSIINQKMEDKWIIKESQNRYSKAAKDWGWREFVTLTNLFDQESGFIVQDTVVFSVEVLVLKETNIIEGFGAPNPDLSAPFSGSQTYMIPRKGSFIWKVENFLSFKEIMETRKIFSRFFQAGGCELRIGVYESFDTICIYLESDQSSGSDPDKNYWVKYRMAVQNQKNPAKTVWKEFSILTKTWNNSVLQFMKVSDMLEPDAGFLVRDTIIFVCDIIDSFPWFDFADLEVLSSLGDQEALSTELDEYVDYEEESESYGSGDEEDMFQDLLKRAGVHLTYGENPSHPKVDSREKLLKDTKSIAKFLTDLREYLDDPTKVKRLFLPTKFSRSSKKHNVNNDTNSPSLINLLMEIKVIQQAIIDLLLDIMVECCQPIETRPCSAPCSNGDSTPSEHSGDNEIPEYSYMYQRLDCEANEPSQAQAIQSSDLNANGTVNSGVSQILICPQTTANGVTSNDGYVRCKKTKWPEQSEELISLIVKSLGTLDSSVPKECSESRIRHQTLQKVLLVLDNTPTHLQADLISVLPKLIDPLEHTFAACELLSRLQTPDILPSSQLPIFGALFQLVIDSALWEQIFSQALRLLKESNAETLVAALEIVFKAASRCHHLPQAARAVRLKLNSLGTSVPQCLLDGLPNIIHSCDDVAQAMLCDIDSDCELDGSFNTESCDVFSLGVNGASCEETNTANSSTNLSDVLLLMEMLSVENLFPDAAQVFERAVVRGSIELRSVSMVLDWRHSMGFSCKSSHVDKQVLLNEKDIVHFTSLLLLCQELSHSKNGRVHDFVRMLYAIMFKIYSEEQYQVKMLNALVDRAITSSNNCQEANIDMDVLAFLVGEDGIAISVMRMMREIVRLTQSDREALRNKVSMLENENARFQLDMDKEQTVFSNEREILNQRLSDSEATNRRLQHELKAEAERFAKEKKDFSSQLNELGKQLDWVISEKDEESKKFCSERKVLQGRLHDTETQLAQLKYRKHDELLRLKKEKSELAERLKNSEAARLRTEDELKNRHANELKNQEAARRLLEDDVKRLKNIIEQTEHDKREKEAQVIDYEKYICDINEWKVNAQQYIQNLKDELENERRNISILYGEGIESLPMDDLEQIRNIHDTRLQHVKEIIQRRKVTQISPFGLNMPQHIFPDICMPNGSSSSSSSSNIGGSHGNGHINNDFGGDPWYDNTNYK